MCTVCIRELMESRNLWSADVPYLRSVKTRSGVFVFDVYNIKRMVLLLRVEDGTL